MGKLKNRCQYQLDKVQKPITKLVFEHAAKEEINPEYYVEGWPFDPDVAELAHQVMDEEFDDVYGGELLIVRMEFLGIQFLDKEKAFQKELLPVVNDHQEYTAIWELLKQARDEADSKNLDRISEGIEILLELINHRCTKHRKL